MNWIDTSEIVTGLLISGRMANSAVRPEHLIAPYDKLAKLYCAGTTAPEDLIEKIGLSPVQACFDAVKNLNGLGEKDWASILEVAATKNEAGILFEKFGQKLQRGEDVDTAKINYYLKLFEQNQSSGFTRLSDVNEEETPYIKTGWKPIDKELWGIPKVGLIVVGGPTGSGKTWFFTRLSSKFAQKYKDKNVVFFSLEMMLGEIKGRYKPYNLSPDIEKRILLNPHPMTVEDIIGKSATIENLGMIGIDFADLLIKEETTASAMEHVYKVLMLGAKELGCPIILLAQLTGYNGGIPKPDQMRWTRLAGMLGWSVWTIYNPMKDWFGEEESKNVGLPIQKNTAFLCAWKMRGGFHKEDEEGNKILREDDPGAIMIPYRPDKGWGSNDCKWFSLQKEG